MFTSILAQSSGEFTSSSLEWDWPLVWKDWIPILLLVVAAIVTIWATLKDTRTLPRGWTTLLAGLRLAFLAVGLLIALNPHERTQIDAYRDSRVLLLIDTSQSMQQPERDPRLSPSGHRTREAAVRELLEDSPLLEQLQAQHAVDVYTFDSDLSPLQVRLPSRFEAGSPAGTSQAGEQRSDAGETLPDKANWEKILSTSGLATRLGDSLDTLLVEAKSPTLSGVVILTDGASNAGRDVVAPRERARELGVRLVAVGTGSTEPPINLEVARLIAPTDVQKGDAFELSAILRGEGLAGRTVHLDLLQKGPSDAEPIVVYSQEPELAGDGQPTEVSFELKPSEAGDFEYTVRARLPEGLETRDDDNQLSRRVGIFDRPLRLLAMAGGPMRDYRFGSVALHRHPSNEIDVWLQSGSVGISQEANSLLFRFPENIEDFYEYDVVLAFDVDWSQLTPEQITMLANWVANEGGGLILIAGDVYTSAVANSDSPELEPLRKLFPVSLEQVSLRLRTPEQSETPFPLRLTQEGSVAEFLKLEETGEKSAWEEFPGIYRTYPTRGPKAGATVYAEFTDPLSRGSGGQPIVLAGQRYGQGQVLYLGSPEMWRLRAEDPAYLDRFWVKMVRKAAEGRSKRGLQRSMFILDGVEFVLGQTVPVRLRALNPQFQPLASDTVTVDVLTSGGVPATPVLELRRDPLRPAEFVGDFRPLTPGRYRLEFSVPDSAERVHTDLDIQLPRQEAASLTQDVTLLKRLVDGTGGTYLPLEVAAAQVPDLLPNRGERVVHDQQVRELWDREWLMFLLVLLVVLEWLARKVLKLA